jgi:hypothetical protein
MIPIVKATFIEEQNDKEKFSKELVHNLFDHIFPDNHQDKNNSNETDLQVTNSIIIEKLQLCTMFVHYSSSKIEDYKKNVLKFTYSHCQSTNYIIAQCSFSLSAHFISKFDVPEKILLKIYSTLLHSYKCFNKSLVNASIDKIIHVLNKNHGEKDSIPSWISKTKKVLHEEANTNAQLMHILSIIQRHSDGFYPYRKYFVLKIVTSLSKISSGSLIENKKFAIQLANLLLEWDETAIKSKYEQLYTVCIDLLKALSGVLSGKKLNKEFLKAAEDTVLNLSIENKNDIENEIGMNQEEFDNNDYVSLDYKKIKRYLKGLHKKKYFEVIPFLLQALKWVCNSIFLLNYYYIFL